MLGKHVGKENPHRVAKDDRVRDLHHGGFHVQRKQNPFVFRVGNFRRQKFSQFGNGHKRSVHDFAGQHRHAVLKQMRRTRTVDQFDFKSTHCFDRHGFFVRSEIIGAHRRHVAF